MKVVPFDPARNIGHRRWLERKLGLDHGDLDPNKPLPDKLPDHPLFDLLGRKP